MRVPYIVQGGKAEGYLALPLGGQGPAVLVLPAWWGLNPFFENLCDRLAAEGFVAFAPDYYGGKIATTPDEAGPLSDSLDGAEVSAIMEAAVAFLLGQPAITGKTIGVVGFSLGVYFAFQLAGNAPDEVGAVVAFYGMGSGNFARSRAAFQGHFAETDVWDAAPEDVARLRDHLTEAGREVSFYIYPGTTHWFFESNVPDAFDAAAAELAWDRMVAFLRERLT